MTNGRHSIHCVVERETLSAVLDAFRASNFKKRGAFYLSAIISFLFSSIFILQPAVCSGDQQVTKSLCE